MAEKIELPEFTLAPAESPKPSAAGAQLPTFAIAQPARTPPALSEDIGKGFLSGVAEGAVALPGIYGSVGQLYDLAARKIAETSAGAAERLGVMPEGKSALDIERAMRPSMREKPSAAEARGETNVILGREYPTMYGMVEGAKRMGMPTYPPQTVPGKYAKTIGENVPGMLIGPGGRLERVLTGIGAGAGSETAGQLYEGKPQEGLARFVGSILGGLTGKAVEVPLTARSAPATTERAGRIAGDILREAETDPKAALQKLYSEISAPKAGRYVEGFEPTPTQIIGTAEAADLENRIMEIARRQSSSLYADLRSIKEAQKGVIESEATMFPGQLRAGVKPVDMQGAYGLQGFNPQGEASVNVKNAVSALEKSMDSAADALWKAPELKSTTLYKNRTLKAVDDFMGSLTEARKTMLDKEVVDLIDRIKSMPGRDVPLQEIQDLRSKILSSARAAGDADDFFKAKVNNDLAQTLAKALDDPGNVVFGDRTGAARSAWENARTATRRYYETFEPKFMNDLISETRGGSQKIAGEATFSKMFSGPNAVQNLQEVRKALGTKVDDQVSNWLIGDLTKNGTKIDLTTDDVAKWLADPKKAAIVDEVPGLRDRITNIAQRAGESEAAATARQLTDGFQRAIDTRNPAVLSKFLDTHATNLKNVATTPAEAEFIDTLKRSTDILAKMPAGKPMAGTKTLDRLADNDIFTILYGRATGAITDGAALAVTAAIVKRTLGMSLPGLEATAFAAGSSGAAKEAVSRVRNAMNNVIFGKTQEETLALLQRAMVDPQLRAVLMQKPTADNLDSLSQLLMRGAERATATVPKVTVPGAMEQMRERPQRKSGGRVSHETAAEHLVMKADKHKKANSKKTETLLEEPDERIVKALEVAKQHI